jgi:predicted ATPase/class 3 adenylate cyclase
MRRAHRTRAYIDGRDPPAHNRWMATLPSGTVTFLFTDIEGSTRLLQELGDGYGDALGEHRRVLRDVVERHGGREVDTQGDAFFIAFARAADALAAADEGQRALEAGPIRVRMGLHTGEPYVIDDGYVGLDVHRAARIAAAAHGGQVLLSQATRDLLDEGVELRDLRLHRLKDFDEPVRLYQLGARTFPPLRTLNQTNLPRPVTTFVGRERAVTDVKALLADEAVRLLTLTGPGGTGKTRLAIQAASELVESFEDGVWWIPLAPLRDPQLVLETIGQTLGAKLELARTIGERRMLLLLDNFEHLLEAAPEVTELVAACSNLSVLATSREPLNVGGERMFAVEPLSEQEAVALFRGRADAAGSSAEAAEAADAVAAICARVDRLPLAIELAAARCRVLAPTQILHRLDRRLPLLTSGRRDAPQRQRTLRATIEWSYDLLDESERELFARLSVFAGGWTVEAAEEVCDADLDTLQSLVDKSLIRRISDERTLMLETIREFAAESLERAGETEALRLRHAEWALRFAEEVAPALEGRQQRSALARLEPERDNIRAALAAFAELGRADERLRLAVATWRLSWLAGPIAEGERELADAIAAAPTSSVECRPIAFRAAGSFAYGRGDWRRAIVLFDRALALSHQLDDELEAALASLGLAGAIATDGDIETARRRAHEAAALTAAAGDMRAAAVADSILGVLALHDRDYTAARNFFERAIPELDGEDYGVVVNLGNLALAAFRVGEIDEAARRLRESLTLGLRLHDPLSTAHAFAVLGAVLAAVGEPLTAAQVIGAGEALREKEGLSLQELERELDAETRTSVTTTLGAPAFARELAVGRSLAPNGVVSDAIAFLSRYPRDESFI